MQWIGRVFLHVPASFGVKADSGEKCTSLLRDVINVHLMQMIEDGFLESAWKQHTQQTATVFCDGTEASEEEEFSDTSKLTLANMGGVFLLHAIFSAASILLAVGVWIYQGRTKKTAALGVIGEEDASMNGIFKDANESENCIDAEEKSPHTPAKHSSLLLSGSVGRDFEVENLRIEMNRKLDKLLKMMEDEKKNA